LELLTAGLGEATVLCFATAAACFLVAAIGSVSNHVMPGGTNVGALSIVGCFYLVLGLIELLRKRTKNAKPRTQLLPDGLQYGNGMTRHTRSDNGAANDLEIAQKRPM